MTPPLLVDYCTTFAYGLVILNQTKHKAQQGGCKKLSVFKKWNAASFQVWKQSEPLLRNWISGERLNRTYCGS